MWDVVPYYGSMPILPAKDSAIRVRVERGERAELELIAQRDGVPMSQVIRWAIEAYIDARTGRNQGFLGLER